MYLKSYQSLLLISVTDAWRKIFEVKRRKKRKKKPNKKKKRLKKKRKNEVEKYVTCKFYLIHKKLFNIWKIGYKY